MTRVCASPSYLGATVYVDSLLCRRHSPAEVGPAGGLGNLETTWEILGHCSLNRLGTTSTHVLSKWVTPPKLDLEWEDLYTL